MPHAKFSQQNIIIYGTIIVADNYNAGMSMDSINMALYDHCTLILVGDVAAAGAGIVTLMAGATNAAETAAITFSSRYTVTDVASVTSDVLTAPDAAATLTLTEAYIKSGMYVFEWDAQDMTVAGVTYQWLTPVLSAAGTAGIVTAIAIGSEPRYAKNIMPSAILDPEA